jgi:Tat protein translocase TatB subunit
MLDFGFSEILLTSAIALVVLGPERLPKVARQVGNWMGRARAMARQLSEQLEREVSADELLKAKTKFENDLMAPLPNRIGPPQYLTPETGVPHEGAHAEYEPAPPPAEPVAMEVPAAAAAPGSAAGKPPAAAPGADHTFPTSNPPHE